MTNCIMVQGTSSNAGKSMLVAALCRIYKNRGYKVAPFKSQNMSLNSYTTKENGEIGIAQMLQAQAAMIEPSVHMNPILLKPKGDFTSNVIIQGKSIGDMNFYDYQHKYHDTALKAIKESLDILKEEYDVIIIEGAGSPAEINMRDQDLANMEIAHLADANVILIADIEMGGVFASIAGTYVLLDDYDRSRLKATVINKFRGNLDILKPGLERIEEITGEPVLGVLPYDETLKLPEEDSASLTTHVFEEDKDITIGVIRLPKIANFTDIDPFEFEDDVSVKMIGVNDDIGDVDAISVCLDTKDPEEFKKAVMLLQKNYAGINLEDISSPKCYDIEDALKETCEIPVFHDDQHGTAIACLSGVLGGLRYIKKDIHTVKIVVNGCGAAGSAIGRLLVNMGATDVTMVDRWGARRGITKSYYILRKVCN